MRNALQLFGSKVVLAILGALIIGGVSAGLAAGTALRPHTSAPGVASANGAANPTTATTATTATQPTVTTTATPTDTPTTAPQTNPTATPGGQVTLNGSIHTLNQNAGTFTLRVNGANDAIVTNGATSFQGNGVQSINDLQDNAQATVTAIPQSNGTYLALMVNSNNQGGD